MSQAKYNDKYLYGGNREKAIKRDKYQCVKCGMTRLEHKQRFRLDITVDHIDGKGKYVSKHERNNSMSNLQTLCLPCHNLKDSKVSYFKVGNAYAYKKGRTAWNKGMKYNVWIKGQAKH